MKPLDMILSVIAVPWFLAGIIAHVNYFAHPLAGTKYISPGISTRSLGVAFGILCFEAWRIYG